MEEKDNTKRNLIIAGVALLIVLIIGLAIYYSGKSAGKQEGAVNVNTTPTDSNGNTISHSEAEIDTIASDLHSDMTGLSLTGHNQAAWNAWLILSDTDFIRVYNAFNEKFQKDSGETLYQWVNDEQSWADLTWYQSKNAAINRMDKLNLK